MNEEKRARDFMAARSLLPSALSDLSHYCKDVIKVYGEAYNRESSDVDECTTL
jgi:hypothetical protein